METMAAIVPKVLEASVRVQAELAQQGIEGGQPRLSSGLGSALLARSGFYDRPTRTPPDD